MDDLGELRSATDVVLYLSRRGMKRPEVSEVGQGDDQRRRVLDAARTVHKFAVLQFGRNLTLIQNR